jgi:uncharacterized protein (UPF0332 family)
MIDDCFDRGLLRKSVVSQNKIINSLKLSEKFLKSAKANLEIGEYEMSFIALYSSMFHSARALLFSKGVTERSHKCMIDYLLKEINNQEIVDILEVMDSYRIMRHKVQYVGSLVSKSDVEEGIRDAERLLKVVRKELKSIY